MARRQRRKRAPERAPGPGSSEAWVLQGIWALSLDTESVAATGHGLPEPIIRPYSFPASPSLHHNLAGPC
jgi:hypothetical protein